ncbi:MAG: rod shape-determining protein MreC [Alistipes sp.]|nr:rod shape-determining protein MreC [Alistipes sp.]
MNRLLEFIKRIYVVLLFILLECIAIWQYATSTPYTEAKILSRTTAVGGYFSRKITNINHFFSLAGENNMLTHRVAELEQTLERERELLADYTEESWQRKMADEDDLHYRYYPARVASMTISHLRNYIILDKGERDGIKKNMGVITPDKYLVGYIIEVSERYSVAMPVLNTEFTMGGSLQMTNYTCSLRWSGDSPYHVDILDVSTYAQPEVGMAVEAWSERMPKGVTVGYIESFEHNAAKTAYSARLKLAVDMSALDNVLIVENTHYGELESLMDNLDIQSSSNGTK